VLGTDVPTLPGSVESGAATVLVRPESVLVAPEPDGNGRVVATTFLGSLCRVQVRLDDGTEVLAQVASAEVTRLKPELPVRVSVRPSPVLAIAGSAGLGDATAG
jgi:putative spermidine/putrescine transport system ATP-binding protein